MEEPRMKTNGSKTKKTVSRQSVTSHDDVRQMPSASSLVADLRHRLGLSRKVFSRLTGFSERNIANWERGGQPDEPSLRRMRETERFQARLAELVDPHAIPAWLDTPNPAFEGLRPLEVIERGEIDRLWNMIYYLESGIAG
jgi:DNA-binding transcriptional regulator YiaG